MNPSYFFNVLQKCTLLLICSLFISCMHRNTAVGATEIEFWSFPNFTSENGSSFEENLITAFETAHPNIHVHFTRITYSDSPAKIEAAIAEHDTPDIIYDAPGCIIVWANKGLLEPLDDVLAAEKPYSTTGLLAVSAGKDRRTYAVHDVNTITQKTKASIDNLVDEVNTFKV